MPNLLTVSQVAERLNCDVSSLYKRIQGGTLTMPYYKLFNNGKGYRFDQKDVDNFIQTRVVKPKK